MTEIIYLERGEKPPAGEAFILIDKQHRGGSSVTFSKKSAVSKYS